jgi:hypothetical protein
MDQVHKETGFCQIKLERPDHQTQSDSFFFIDCLPQALRRAADFVEQHNIDEADIIIDGENEDGDWRVVVYCNLEAA